MEQSIDLEKSTSAIYLDQSPFVVDQYLQVLNSPADKSEHSNLQSISAALE